VVRKRLKDQSKKNIVEERIKSFIAEWLTNKLPKLFERELSLPVDKDYVITVTGGRRSGKTFLLYQTIKKVVENGLASSTKYSTWTLRITG
jgi:hypothetical protein